MMDVLLSHHSALQDSLLALQAGRNPPATQVSLLALRATHNLQPINPSTHQPINYPTFHLTLAR